MSLRRVAVKEGEKKAQIGVKPVAAEEGTCKKPSPSGRVG
jgi:hypothetical protein